MVALWVYSILLWFIPQTPQWPTNRKDLVNIYSSVNTVYYVLAHNM